MSSIPNLKTTVQDGIPEVDVDEVFRHSSELLLIDVRRPDEFNNELGHIQNSQLITLGPDLQSFIHSNEHQDRHVVFVCRSGSRSGTATLMAREAGLRNSFNMTGGMLRWNDLNLPVVRDEN